MNDDLNCKRNWRLDPASAVSPGPAAESVPLPTIPWRARALSWAKEQVKRFIGPPRMTPEEEMVHQMARLLQHTDDPRVIEQSLIGWVGRATRARSVELIREGEHAPVALEAGDGGGMLQRRDAPSDPRSQPRQEPDATECELVLRCGPRIWGRLRIAPAVNQPQAWPPATLLRLKTLCTMVACALERLDWQEAHARKAVGDLWDAPPDAPSGAPACCLSAWEMDTPRRPSMAVVQDATFLNAVLPFALSQARRHREPLSLLCLAIDRLGGIEELLGRDRAHRVVQNVALHVAKMIRTSDIVARIDDDRIITVLPRAQAQDALRVAQNICRTIERNPTLLPELPVLTVSMGVASYPTCANTVYGLLDAADHALALAQSQGRNRAVAAPALTGQAQPKVKLGSLR